MRFFPLLAFLFLLSYASSSFALTPGEVRRSYDTCMAFLKLPLSKQKLAAKKSGYSLSEVLWACHLQARHSLAYMQRQEREYQRQLRDGGSSYDNGSSGGSIDNGANDPYGGSGGGFGGPGVCTNGVCNGPGGTTVCTNGVCN